MQKKVAKSELLEENTGLKCENEELKNRLAQMEAMLRSLQGSGAVLPTVAPLPSERLAPEEPKSPQGEEDTIPPLEESSEISITFQAHHMISSESDLSVGLVIDGVSVKRKKKRSRGSKAKKRTGKKKPHKSRRKRKQKPREKKGKNARKKEEGRSISFTATNTVPDEVLGAFEFPEKRTEEMKKMVHTRLREKGVDLKKVSTEETVEKLLQEELAKGKRSAFYLVNLGTLAEKYSEWQRLLPRVEPHYAMKCNPDFVLVQTLGMLGVGFDCASKRELEIAFAAGATPDKIIFANPCKQVEHIEYSKQMGVKLMTFDSKEELLKVLCRYPEAELVLRVLPDDSNSLMPFGTKFGAGREEVTDLLAMCKSHNANLVGVSFHVGSGCYSVDAFTDAIRLARSVFDEAENHGFNLKLLDIGGGFPGISTNTSNFYDSSDSESDHEGGRGYESGAGGNEMSPQISFEDIALAIGPLIDELFPSEVRVISEPGRFFVTAAATLAVNVVCRRERVRGYLKENRAMIGNSIPTDDAAVIEQIEAEEISAGSGDESSSGLEADEQLTKEVLYYLSDGIYGSFNNIIFDHATPLPALLSSPGAEEIERQGLPVKRERSCLFGPTCDSIDVICKNVSLPRLNVGDWLYFVNMGAYTTASASNFNGIGVPDYCYIISMLPDTPSFPFPAPAVDIIK